MARKFRIIVVAAALAATAAVPAVAQASGLTTSAVTRGVHRQYSRTVHNRARLIGWRAVSVKVRCSHDTGRYYSCYGTYTLGRGHQRLRYGVFINVVGHRWHAGRTTLLRRWRA